MLSMAVRVAQALMLHMPQYPARPFEKEMRRRLWHAIGLLDVQAALDRGSEPMMKASWLQFLPSNLNDECMTLYSQELVSDSEGYTDMAFTLIMSKAQCVIRSLNFGDLMEPGIVNMHMRQACVIVFRETASRLLQNCQPDTEPFHWYAKQVAECIDASLQLIVLRPMQYNPKFTPSRIRGSGLLKLAVKALQKTQAQYTDERGWRWRWFRPILDPRHTLAIAIAELCVCEDLGLIERCWPVVESSFNRFNKVGSSHDGLLWKPIEEGLARARAKRESLLGSSLMDDIAGPGLSSGSRSGFDWTTLPSSDPDSHLNIWDKTVFDGADSDDNFLDMLWAV